MMGYLLLFWTPFLPTLNQVSQASQPIKSPSSSSSDTSSSSSDSAEASSSFLRLFAELHSEPSWPDKRFVGNELNLLACLPCCLHSQSTSAQVNLLPARS